MKRNQTGFAVLELILVVVILGVLGFVGWFVVHSKHKTEAALKPTNNTVQTPSPAKKVANNSTASAPAAGTDNASLNNDMNAINSSQSQENQDSASANSGLNDQQSEITVPTN